MAKQPQNVKTEDTKVTTQVTAEPSVPAAKQTELYVPEKTLTEMSRGRAALAKYVGRPVPEPEPNLNVIVELGPVLPVAAKEASINKSPSASALPTG